MAGALVLPNIPDGFELDGPGYYGTGESSGAPAIPEGFEADDEFANAPKAGKEKKKKRWESDAQMWSSHGEGARRAELTKKAAEEEKSGKKFKRGAVKGTLTGLGGVTGAIVGGVPTFGGLATPAGLGGMAIGYGLGEVASNAMYGEDPSEELKKMGPLATAGPVGGMEGAKRMVRNAPQSLMNLASMPYEMTKSVTDPMLQGDVAGMMEAGKNIPVGLADMAYTGTGTRDVVEKLTRQQPMDLIPRNQMLMAEEDPVGTLFGAHMGMKVPGAAVKAGKYTFNKGLGALTEPHLATDLYRSAMKPTVKEGKAAEVAQAIDRGLETGAVINRKGSGLEKVVRRVEAKEDIIEGILDPATERVNIGKLDRALDRVRKDAADDIENVDMIRSTADKYVEKMRSHHAYDPTTDSIPVQAANTIKRRLYKNLRKGGAYDEGQVLAGRGTAAKGTARTLMTAIEEAVPELGPLNKELGKDLNLQKYLERATRRIENTDVLGMRTRLAMLMGVAAPKYAIVSLAAAITDNPSFKSRLAIAIHKAHKGKMSAAEVNRIVEDIPARMQQQQEASRQQFNPETPGENFTGSETAYGRSPGEVGLEEGGIPPRTNMDTSFNPETPGPKLPSSLGDTVVRTPEMSMESGAMPRGGAVADAESLPPRPRPNSGITELENPQLSAQQDLAYAQTKLREMGFPDEQIKALNSEEGAKLGYFTRNLEKMGYTPEQVQIYLKAAAKGGVAAGIAALLPFLLTKTTQSSSD